MSSFLERRLRQLRSRALIRAWAFRQRDRSHGVWFRLRRVLADAREAWEIPEIEAQALIAEGNPAAPVGAELEPPRLIVFASRARVERIAGARELPVGLGADLLEAQALALTPFDSRR